MFEPIDFNCFFMGVKGNLSLDLLRTLNPYDRSMNYTKINDVYMAWSMLDSTTIFINMLSGRGSFLKDLKKVINKSQIKTIRFGTTKDNKPMMVIRKYYNATLYEVVDDYFGDGKDLLVFDIDVNGRRLQSEQSIKHSS